MDRIVVMELVRSFQLGQLDRRAFLARATKALGSAAAAGLLLSACQHADEDDPPPVVTQPRRDDTETAAVAGLVAGMVDYPGPDGAELMGYLARPEGETARPGVVVVQEWWGLDDHIKELARRFAQAGYAALAPDLYHGAVTSEPDEARKLAMALDRDAAVDEIHSAADHLRDAAGAPKVGAVGFCMGGWLVLQGALDDDALAAVVAFYGRPLGAEDAARARAPVMGNYGARAGALRGAAVGAMAQAREAAGVPVDGKVYEGAPHAFFNDTRPSYRAEAAQDAWARTLGWFETHLG